MDIIVILWKIATKQPLTRQEQHWASEIYTLDQESGWNGGKSLDFLSFVAGAQDPSDPYILDTAAELLAEYCKGE